MTLSDYLKANRGAQAALCAAIGAHSPDMSRWAAGQRPVPDERCPFIERATNGRVTCEELLPDVRWQRVPDAAWPHPGGRPCIDVAAPACTDTRAVLRNGAAVNDAMGVCDAA